MLNTGDKTTENFAIWLKVFHGSAYLIKDLSVIAVELYSTV